MKAPAKVKIGFRVYDVVVDKNAINACTAAHGNGVQYGECNHESLVITVDPTQNTLMVQETMLHEILHACMSLIGVSEEMDEKTEESLVLRLSPVLMGFMKDNPKMLDYLTEDPAKKTVSR